MFGQLVDETNLPIRKRLRRRPALSCIECRRRKIKCDRNHPCNHCKQTKNVACVYKDLHTITPRQAPSDTLPAANIEAHRHEFRYQPPSQDQSPSSASSYLENFESESNLTNSTLLTTIEDPVDKRSGQNLVNGANFLEQPIPDGMSATEEEIKGTRWQRALGVNFSTFNDIIVEDGPAGAKVRTKFFNRCDQTPITELRGTISKTRFFGNSHWMTSFDQFDRISAFKDKTVQMLDTNDANSEVRQLLEECKTTARKIKAQRSVQWHSNPDFKTYVPARDISDQLVQLYLRTMESNHRILHIPQFLREYETFWSNPAKTSQASAVKIILVMAIGACFYQGPDNDNLRADAQQWVYSAQSWVSAPFEKGRLNLPGLQIQCLLLLARQINAIGGDVIWVAAGSLLRSAFQMGFHLDPKYYPKMSVLHGELRRRLWATVLELTVQTAIDSGMPPLITPNDYNTQPPSNINDEDISESTQFMPTPKPPHVFTRSSMQIQLLKSIDTRLGVVTVLNNFHSEPSYDTILKLSSEMAQACKESSLLVKSYPLSQPHPSAIQRNLLDMFIRRFLLSIHRPFAAKSRSEPRYYFSRKVCADTALIILSYSGRDTPTSLTPISVPRDDSAESEIMDDYSRLIAIAGGLYKEVVFHAGLIATFELITQLEEEASSGLASSPSSEAARQPFRDGLRDLQKLITLRIQLGENNVKALLFVQAAIGQIEALDNGHDPDVAIIEAARIGARRCLDLLRMRYKSTPAPSNVSAVVDGDVDGKGTWPTEVVNPDPNYEYDFMIPDDSPDSGMSNFNFDIPESWLFSNWGDNQI